MGLADDLTQGPPVRTYQHKVEKILASLPSKERSLLDAALRNPAWTAAALATALRRAGSPVSIGAIKNWREVNGVG